MGLFDRFKAERSEVKETKTALEAAQDPGSDDGAVNRVIQLLLDLGVDGAGPLSSAQQLADKALASEGSPEKAIEKLVSRSRLGGAIGGFATGLGGFVTMPVALPANVLEFYVQATRMTAAIAAVRGYDLTDPKIRTAVLLTLVGSNAEDVLKKAGASVGGGRIASMALKDLPPAALMVVNKAVGFRLLRGVGEKFLSRLGRGVPLAGGVVGGGLDHYMMGKIADQAKKEFPAVPPTAA